MKLTPRVTASLDYVQSVIAVYGGGNVSREMHPDDDMIHKDWDKELIHYNRSGMDALEIVLQAMVLTEVNHVGAILDMPCGFGRVARHLRAAFPEAELTCCELYQDRVDFCRRAFNAVGVKSKENFDEISFASKFDVIWCGSLLTHLPEPLFKKCLNLFSRSLNPNGIAVVTTQGRHAPFIQKNFWKLLPDEAYADVERQYETTGFGYADYNAKATFFEQDAYGIAIAKPSYQLKLLEDDTSIRIQGLMERRWDSCQDVVIFRKIDLHTQAND